VAHVVQHTLDNPGGFRPGQAEAAMDDVGKICTCQSICGVGVVSDPRDAKIGHHILPAWSGVPPAVSVSLS
jgi:hypothetical protein